ncbi:MAG: hypothetical protein HYZ57_21435 [Acidobacteria bacterium]|nr:hypothetical protein [Acidobacteriota bacterium]
MSETQLYISVGIPSLLILVAMLVNASHLSSINGRISGAESGLASVDNRMPALENRVDSRTQALEAKFDLLTGKVVEIDNRLTRVGEQLKHLR